MNCKPGDLAVVVRVGPNTSRALGKIVTVTRLHPFAAVPAWEYTPKMEFDGYEVCVAEDCCLRPLRDKPGQDEMEKIAGKPIKGSA